jgi:hypothetical protein
MALETRLKLFLDENHRLVVGVLLLGALLCFAGAGFVYATPSTETVTQETDSQTFSTGVSSSAVVTQPTELYRQGEILENRSVYFTSASPSFRLNVTTSAPAGESVQIDQQLELEALGVRDGRPFYSSTRTFVEANRTVSDGQLRASQTVNITDLSRDLVAVEQEIQEVGQFQLRLRLTVTYSTDEHQGTLQATAPFVIDGQAYYLDGSLNAAETETTVASREITQPPDPAVYGGLGALGVVLVVAAAAVSRAESLIDPAALRREIVHDRHAEWISKGEFPTSADKPYISILTLEDLVDVAIDTNRRVIYDPQIDAYAVIDASEVYYYAIEDVRADDWLDI